MTWNELKKLVDKELDGKDIEICYIGIMSYPRIEYIDVYTGGDELTIQGG